MFVSVCVYFMAELWFRVALSSYLSKYMCFYCGIVSEIALRNWKFNHTEQIFTNFKFIFLFVRNKTLISNRLYSLVLLQFLLQWISHFCCEAIVLTFSSMVCVRWTHCCCKCNSFFFRLANIVTNLIYTSGIASHLFESCEVNSFA